MFKIKNLKYKNILNIDNLQIERQKVTCIVGESGSGKTTLLRMLNKMITCDSGEILYNESPIANFDSIKLRREVVMLPQTPIIYEGSIKDNLLIGIDFSEKKIPNDDELLVVLKSIGIDKNLDDLPENLSGGEKQRLAIARVLLLKPEVLLLDEPSSALDEKNELNIISLITTYIRDYDKTLIIVTHSKKVSSIFADNIVKLRNGMLVSEV